jgi:hypothetical protein
MARIAPMHRTRAERAGLEPDEGEPCREEDGARALQPAPMHEANIYRAASFSR